ncbi:MAG: DUF928 domain-containing protein [Cyanobacteria bacterium J06592_8]
MIKLFQSSVLGIIGAALFNIIPVYAQTSAQTIQPISNRYPSTSELKIYFQAPTSNSEVPDNGTPNSEGTASRSGSCIAKDIPLTIVTGQSETLTLTASSHPTFFVYVPYTSSEVSYGIFTLYDSQTKQEVWNVVFQLPTEPGILSIPSPKNASALEIDQSYRWFFELNCESQNGTEPQPLMVQGTVKRISSQAFEADLSTATPLEKVNIYAAQGLWYDAVALLATLQQKDPSNSQLKTLWVELLKASNSRKLEPIYQESLVGNIILDF